jgi:hypothetical protein
LTCCSFEINLQPNFDQPAPLLVVVYAESERIDKGINRDRYSMAQKSFHPGPAVMRAGNYLAVTCLFVGAAVAAFFSGSLKARLGNLFVFGVVPAVGFYAGAYVLGQLLVFGVKLCDKIMAGVAQYAANLANALLNWAGAHVSSWLAGDVHTKSNAAGPNANEFEFEVRRGWRFWSLIVAAVSLTGVGLGWLITSPSNWHPLSQRETIQAMVQRIIGVESDGDPNAKNKRSSATGLGQFLDETWLDVIRGAARRKS